VNVPAERLSLPVIGERDRELAAFAAAEGVDFVGQSFVRAAADVVALRELLGADGPRIVAKIETRPAVDAFEAVAAAADGVMVARGDLGLDLPFEDVPIVQKRLVATAVRLRRPVIVATQMLESMLAMPRPTRAEASDVANAVLDGADAVMLSGETAIGSYPLEAAEAAIRICRAAEAGARDAGTPPGGSAEPSLRGGRRRAMVLAAVSLAGADPAVGALVVVSADPAVPALVAAHRPAVPVIAAVPDERLARALALSRGVTAVVPAGDDLAWDGTASAARLLEDAAVRRATAGRGRIVLLAAGRDASAERIEVAAAPPDEGGDAA
jgi:pyruvate kinase